LKLRRATAACQSATTPRVREGKVNLPWSDHTFIAIITHLAPSHPTTVLDSHQPLIPLARLLSLSPFPFLSSTIIPFQRAINSRCEFKAMLSSPHAPPQPIPPVCSADARTLDASEPQLESFANTFIDNTVADRGETITALTTVIDLT
jgi:hypothetical protein